MKNALPPEAGMEPVDDAGWQRVRLLGTPAPLIDGVVYRGSRDVAALLEALAR